MSCNLHNNDIDLDDQSLFEYVSQLDVIEDSIKYVPPKYPLTFGNMTEQFKNKQTSDEEDDDNEKKSSNGFLVVVAIVIILLLVVCAVVYYGSCGQNYDNMAQFNSLSPEIGPDVRAIFVRN
jgi:hypothetical protein